MTETVYRWRAKTPKRASLRIDESAIFQAICMLMCQIDAFDVNH